MNDKMLYPDSPACQEAAAMREQFAAYISQSFRTRLACVRDLQAAIAYFVPNLHPIVREKARAYHEYCEKHQQYIRRVAFVASTRELKLAEKMEAAHESGRSQLRRAEARFAAERAAFEVERRAWRKEKAAFQVERAAFEEERGVFEEERSAWREKEAAFVAERDAPVQPIEEVDVKRLQAVGEYDAQVDAALDVEADAFMAKMGMVNERAAAVDEQLQHAVELHDDVREQLAAFQRPLEVDREVANGDAQGDDAHTNVEVPAAPAALLAAPPGAPPAQPFPEHGPEPQRPREMPPMYQRHARELPRYMRGTQASIRRATEWK